MPGLMEWPGRAAMGVLPISRKLGRPGMWMKGGPRSAIATKLESRKFAVYNRNNPVKFVTVSDSQRWCSLMVLHQYPSAFLGSVH